MFGLSLTELFKGFFASFLFGVASAVLYYVLLSVFETVKKTISAFKNMNKKTAAGFKVIFREAIMTEASVSGITRHIYDFLTIFCFSVAYSVLNFAFFDGVIRFASFFALLLGAYLTKPVMKKAAHAYTKAICLIFLLLPIALYCIKRYIFEKNNKFLHKSEQNVSNL